MCRRRGLDGGSPTLWAAQSAPFKSTNFAHSSGGGLLTDLTPTLRVCLARAGLGALPGPCTLRKAPPELPAITPLWA